MTTRGRIVLVPGALALLPEHRSLKDPVASLRRACLAAVERLSTRVEVVATESGARVAHYLLDATERIGDETTWLVVGNGSATRSEKAPGHLDPRAAAFDRTLRTLLTSPDPQGLVGIDADLAIDLWAEAEPLAVLGRDLLRVNSHAVVTYDDHPFGVQYWVITWDTSDMPGSGSQADSMLRNR